MSWPLPGTHIPNQFVAQVIGAGVSFEMAAVFNHAIILGFYDTDLGYISALPSFEVAKFSGHPSLYYSKYSWDQLGVALFRESAQTIWQKREVWLRFYYPSCLWSKTKHLLRLPFLCSWVDGMQLGP